MVSPLVRGPAAPAPGGVFRTTSGGATGRSAATRRSVDAQLRGAMWSVPRTERAGGPTGGWRRSGRRRRVGATATGGGRGGGRGDHGAGGDGRRRTHGVAVGLTRPRAVRGGGGGGHG